MPDTPELTVVVISYNTRELTLAALRTLYETTKKTTMHVVVLDNASRDGSAEAIAGAFPGVELIASPDNLGFARANNEVIARATTEWVLLLNPDTECHEGAVDNLMAFARANPKAGIYGGRTVFRDGSLNIASCWNRITPWSMVCRTTGLFSLFSRSEVFNPEGIGGWKRDTVRHVDIVVGCFMLMRRALWDELDGFDLKYFMYGEEADLCLRAREKGLRPMITPDAEIMHIVGAAMDKKGDKLAPVHKARATLIRDHWPKWQVPFGIGLMWLGVGLRVAGTSLAGRVLGGRIAERGRAYRAFWARRSDWLKGY
ncbi:MAG: glycosyltransferase family 2 protein [Rhodobacteraceae bacterium]|nr:glycosyltransferase family 2 protein [Paracoccaceae bacterium]